MADKVQPTTTVPNGNGSNGHNGTGTPIPTMKKTNTDDTDLDDYFVGSVPIRNLMQEYMLTRL